MGRCRNTLGIGRMILGRAMANASTIPKIFTLESGKMINAMERWAKCFTKRENGTAELGVKTISTAKVLSSIKMVKNLKAPLNKIRNMERAL
jgi:hypothetical protein